MGQTVIGHLQECPDATAVMAYDIDPVRVGQACTAFNTEGTTDLKTVLRDPTIALVFVTASNNAHKDLAVQALEASKAVMCEKPMAPSLAEASEMVEVAERTGGFLQIGFEMRYSKLFTIVKDWIDRGLLGRVINTHCEYVCSEFWGVDTWRSKGLGGGMFGEKLSHYVDLPRWWIGDRISEIHCVCAPNVVPYFRVHDNYQTICRFQEGAVSSLTFMMGPPATFEGDPQKNFVDQQQNDGHELRHFIQGMRGAAATDAFSRSIRRWAFSCDNDRGGQFISRCVETLTWDGTKDDEYFHNTRDQTHDIVRRVKQGLPPALSVRDAYETMQVCFAAEQSADKGCSVHLNYSNRTNTANKDYEQDRSKLPSS